MTRNGKLPKQRLFFTSSGRPFEIAPDDPDLLEVQQILLEGTSLARPKPSPEVNLHDLSVEELEKILVRKKAELGQLQPAVAVSTQRVNPVPTPNSPISPSLSARFRPESPLFQAEPANAESRQAFGFASPDFPDLDFLKDEPGRRFAPATLVAMAPVAPAKSSSPRKSGPFQSTRNAVGYVLEVLVIVAALGLAGNWLLQQSGINLNFFAPAQVSDLLVAPSRPEGLFLNAQAAGTIALPPTATPAPPTATATVAPTPITLPDFSPVAILPTVVPEKTAVPEAIATPEATATSTPALAVAPTPTPAVVQPVKQSVAQGAATPQPPPGPPKRLVIPKIGVDTKVEEVTINLGTWQVADWVAGHHEGTAMPGQNGNMVLVGHRDIRGSIFLRLNELQKGDEFQVFTDTASYRYVITEVREVAPTEVSVLNPTLDPTATLITCTPIGLATHRLVLKAALEK